MTNVPNLRRLLVRNLTYQGATEAVGLTSGLIVTLVLSRHLGVEGFGGFNYLFAFLYFFLTFNDLGINTIVVRESSRDPDRAGAFIGGMLSFRVILAAFSVVVICILAVVVDYPTELRLSLMIFGFFLPLNALRLPATIFQSRLRFDLGATVEIVTRVATVTLVLVAVSLRARLIGVTLALVAGEALGVGLALTLASGIVQWRWRVDPSEWAKFLRSSLPLAVAGVLVASTNRLDFLMLERMAGLEQVGLYGAAYKVTSLLERFPQLIMLTLYPVMASIAQHDVSGLRSIYRRSLAGLGTLAIIVTGLVIWLSPEILRFFGQEFVPASSGLRMLVLSTACLYVALTGGHLLIAVGWERVSLGVWVIAASVNVALNFLWIPTRGFVGAAQATAVSYAFVLLCTLVGVEVWLNQHASGVQAADPVPAAEQKSVGARVS